MADQINPELFEHLVELAALSLSAEESEYLRGELNSQLKAIDELAAVPIPEGTPPAAHGVAYPLGNRPPGRPDAVEDSGLAETILAQAPETDDGYLAVPETPHEDLE
jgi:aspartyl/glutamyl-tRNA(Asn/Gln) amidotransferase C subunit